MIKLEWSIRIGFHWNMFHSLLLNGHWTGTALSHGQVLHYPRRRHSTPGQGQREPASHRATSCPRGASVRQQLVRKLKIDRCLSQWIKTNHGDQLLPPYFPPALVRVHVLIKLQVWPTLQRTSPSWCLIPVCSNCHCVHQGLASESTLPLKFKPQSTEQALLM